MFSFQLQVESEKQTKSFLKMKIFPDWKKKPPFDKNTTTNINLLAGKTVYNYQTFPTAELF